MIREEASVTVSNGITGKDREDLTILINKHKFFRGAFLNSAPDLDLRNGDNIEKSEDFKEFVDTLVSNLTVKKYRKGRFIINMHDLPDEMYIISQGR